MMGDVLESVAQEKVQNNLEREEMSGESGQGECRERSPEEESKRPEEPEVLSDAQ